MIWLKKPLTRLNKTILIVVFLLCVVAAGTLVWTLKRGRNPGPAPRHAAASAEDAIVKSDRDNDGLKDWEESIFKTDPDKPDTDGDGTIDGEEITQNRDPLVAGPLDPAVSSNAASEEGNKYAVLRGMAEQDNLTKLISNQVLKETGLGGLLNPKNAQQISGRILAMIDELKKHGPKFSESTIPDEMIIVADAQDTQHIKNYFNAIAAIYSRFVPKLNTLTDEPTAIKEALDAQSGEPFKKLEEPLALLRSLAAEVRRTPAPRSLTGLHKKEIWIVETGNEQLALLIKANPADPLYVTLLLNLRLELKKEMADLHGKTIPEWLAQHDITFDANEKARELYPLPT